MTKPNYQAWHINHDEFSHSWTPLQKLEFFACYAVLAPSGHNTQPWQFKRLEDGESLVLRVNEARNLPFSGALAAEPYVSIGSCLETFIQAAHGFGYAIAATSSFGGEDDKDVTVKLQLGAKVSADDRLPQAITQRVSNRNFFKLEAAPTSTLEHIVHNDFSKLSVTLVKARADIDYLAEQTKLATSKIMSERPFRDELSHWVRNNVTRQFDGMPGFVQGMPTPPSLIAKYVVKYVDISGSQAKLDASRVSNAPQLALIAVSENTPQAFLQAGQLYARIGIRAQVEGVATSGVGAALIDPDTKRAVAEHFAMRHFPAALLRLGYATKSARHSPRWPIEDVLVD